MTSCSVSDVFPATPEDKKESRFRIFRFFRSKDASITSKNKIEQNPTSVPEIRILNPTNDCKKKLLDSSDADIPHNKNMHSSEKPTASLLSDSLKLVDEFSIEKKLTETVVHSTDTSKKVQSKKSLKKKIDKKGDVFNHLSAF